MKEDYLVYEKKCNNHGSLKRYLVIYFLLLMLSMVKNWFIEEVFCNFLLLTLGQGLDD